MRWWRPYIEEHQGAFLIASAALVFAIGARQLRRGLQPRHAVAPVDVDRVSAVAACARFVALTAINPMTLVYFVALSAVVTDPGGTWIAPVAVFILAVGLSSLAWQLALAAAGSLLEGSLGGRATHTIDLVASKSRTRSRWCLLTSLQLRNSSPHEDSSPQSVCPTTARGASS